MRSTDQTTPPPVRTPPNPSPWLARAWAAVALVPVFFLVAFAVGEGLYALMGYDPGTGDAPVWADLVAVVVVLAVVLVPCVAAISFGRRAERAGDRRGRIPLVIGLIAAIGWTVLTLVSEIGDMVRR